MLHQADWISGRLAAHYGITDENNALKLGYDPVYRVWAGITLHVGDCAIVPAATYGIRGSGDGIVFSDALEVATIRNPGDKHYADIAGPVAPGTCETGDYTPPDGAERIPFAPPARGDLARDAEMTGGR